MNRSLGLDIGITKVLKSTSFFLLGLCLYLESVAPHTIYSQITLLLSSLIMILYSCFSRRKGEVCINLKLNPLIICYAFFILYQFVLVAVGKVYNRNVSLDDLKTMFITLVFLFSSFNFLRKDNNINNFKSLLFFIGVIGALTILYCCRDTIGTGRLGHTYKEYGGGYTFLGLSIRTSSNGFASFWSFAFLCGAMKTYNEKNFLKKLLYCLCLLFLIVCVLLTGSRKGVFTLGVCILAAFVLNPHSKSQFLRLIFGICLIICFYFVVINVSFLRSIIGERLELLVNSIIFGSDEMEGSMQSRNYYAEQGWISFANSPLIGHGVGWFKSTYTNVCENEYLEILVSGGIIGFIIYFFYLPFIIIKIIKIMLSKKKNRDAVFYGVILLVSLIDMLGSTIYLSRGSLFYMMLIFVAIEKEKHNFIVKTNPINKTNYLITKSY